MKNLHFSSSQLFRIFFLHYALLFSCFCFAEGVHNDICYSIIDKDSEDKVDVIQDVLTLQKTLIVDSDTANELPTIFEENGFLTVKKTAEELAHILQHDGKIFIVRHLDQLIAYLILSDLDDFFSRIVSPDVHVEIDLPLQLSEIECFYMNNQIKMVDQIGVATHYAKQGIGRHLVNMAKQVAPQGLSTCILYMPFTNNASLAFFSKQGFVRIANVHVLGKPPKCIPHEIWVEHWIPENDSQN